MVEDSVLPQEFDDVVISCPRLSDIASMTVRGETDHSRSSSLGYAVGT